jgi:hypothetical protein
MLLNAYCPYCEKKVSVALVLTGNELEAALGSDKEVRVMHVADVDHVWNLIKPEKENLRNAIATGLVS